MFKSDNSSIFSPTEMRKSLLENSQLEIISSEKKTLINKALKGTIVNHKCHSKNVVLFLQKACSDVNINNC